jgi:hypothetical protein
MLTKVLRMVGELTGLRETFTALETVNRPCTVFCLNVCSFFFSAPVEGETQD